ncbi:hypothetical protein ACTMTI_44235 [Nonomuraea sp. H19]|uniref:hypothetical protein n=1 Tax=Nonomuraea sp. H19 TaxID=3452206 RepID=UPI003F8C1299
MLYFGRATGNQYLESKVRSFQALTGAAANGLHGKPRLPAPWGRHIAGIQQ